MAWVLLLIAAFRSVPGLSHRGGSLLQSLPSPSSRAMPGSWKLGLFHSSFLQATATYLIWDLLPSQYCYRLCTNIIFCNSSSSFPSLLLHSHELGSQSIYFPYFQSTHSYSCKSGESCISTTLRLPTKASPPRGHTFYFPTPGAWSCTPPGFWGKLWSLQV